MVETDETGKTYAIKDKIAEGIDEGENKTLDKEADINTLLVSISKIKSALQKRMNGLPNDQELRQHLQSLDAKTLRTLVVSNPWNTRKVGGEEVDIDLLFEEPEIFNFEEAEVPSIEQPMLLATLLSKTNSNEAPIPFKLEIMSNMDNINIGRNKEWSDFHIENKHVSRYHAIIKTSKNKELLIEDNDSTGGTFLNGEQLQLSEQRMLKHNDKIGFSESIIYKVVIL